MNSSKITNSEICTVTWDADDLGRTVEISDCASYSSEVHSDSFSKAWEQALAELFHQNQTSYYQKLEQNGIPKDCSRTEIRNSYGQFWKEKCTYYKPDTSQSDAITYFKESLRDSLSIKNSRDRILKSLGNYYQQMTRKSPIPLFWRY